MAQTDGLVKRVLGVCSNQDWDSVDQLVGEFWRSLKESIVGIAVDSVDGATIN